MTGICELRTMQDCLPRLPNNTLLSNSVFLIWIIFGWGYCFPQTWPHAHVNMIFTCNKHALNINSGNMWPSYSSNSSNFLRLGLFRNWNLPYFLFIVKVYGSILGYVIRETFKGENFCEFQGFVAICKSFLREIGGRGIFWQWHQQVSFSWLVSTVKFF